MTILSICIPTYNRAAHLRNCLSAFIQCGLSNLSGVQICISDNCSTDTTKQVVAEAGKELTIKYKVNQSNIGSARNFLEVVQMAEGEFVWMLGDDDLLMPGACEKIIKMIKKHSLVDYFFVNANHLTIEYVQSFSQPFELENLPKAMERFSSRAESGELPFLELIDPKVSFDFLGGIFLSVFRRGMWLSHVDCLDKYALADGASRPFSHIDNTFPHAKIFANAFSNSLAYFSADPASVCLSGVREWAPMGPLVMSIRLPEALEEYKINGLKWHTYFYCRNAALSNFFPHMVRLIFNGKEFGGNALSSSIRCYWFCLPECEKHNQHCLYVNVPKILFKNCIYPNAYLSVFYVFFRKLFWVKVKIFFLRTISSVRG